jgi:hypothetical protein
MLQYRTLFYFKTYPKGVNLFTCVFTKKLCIKKNKTGMYIL